jgi:hypothetical protein
MARRFGDLDLTDQQTTSGDVVFFALPGLGMLRYPFAWVGAITLLTLIFAAAVVERAFRSRRASPLGALGGLAVAVVAIGVSSGLGWLLWSVVQGAHHELGSIQGRALYSEGWYGAALGGFTLAAVAALLFAARTVLTLASLLTGALLLPLALALLAWWYAPGVSMLFVWPVLMATGALRYAAARRDAEPYRISELAAVGLLSAPTIFIQFPLIWTIFQGLNISVAPLIGGLVALMLLLLLPLLDIASRPNRVWLPASAAGLAIAFTAIGLVDARPSPSRPIPSDLVYALDREQGTAVWATMQRDADGWVENFVGDNAELFDLSAFLGGNPRPYRRAPAPLMEVPDAQVRVVADVVDGGIRRVRLEIESALAPELLNLSPGPGSGVFLTALNGTPVVPRIDAGGGAPWLLQHFGQPPAGVLTVDLEAPLDTPFELVLVEFVMRLPPLAEVNTERPPGWTPHAGRLTDASMFRQLIRVQ